jgi:hypothetical protein
MKIKLILFLLLFAVPVLAVSQKSIYIGYRHKGVVYGQTLSNGVRDLGGGLLTNENFGVTRYAKNGNQMLWLERILERDAKGVPTWQVRDVLMLGKMNKNQEILFSYSSTCTRNGAENLDLIVMAEKSADKKTYKILQAWEADIKSEKFKKASAKGIKCEISEN